MNRLTATGLVAEVQRGRDIIVLVRSVTDVREVTTLLAESGPHLKSTCGYGTGVVTDESTGRRIYVQPSSRETRGLSADVAYIDTDAGMRLGPMEWESLRASLRTSDVAEIIRA